MNKTNILIHYMESRLRKDPVITDPGPVITISREAGCPAKLVAGELQALLNDERKGQPIWRCLSNELLEESARKLKVEAKDIKHIFTYNDRNMLDEILAATKKDHSYKSDRAIKNTIGSVIRSVGEKGHYIIIGRGGVAHTRHISKSLHVRLIAPVKWRIRQLMEHKQLTEKDAALKVEQLDKNRKQFLSYYLGDTCLTDYFDLTINSASFSVSDCADLIFRCFNKVMESGKTRTEHAQIKI